MASRSGRRSYVAFSATENDALLSAWEDRLHDFKEGKVNVPGRIVMKEGTVIKVSKGTTGRGCLCVRLIDREVLRRFQSGPKKPGRLPSPALGPFPMPFSNFLPRARQHRLSRPAGKRQFRQCVLFNDFFVYGEMKKNNKLYVKGTIPTHLVAVVDPSLHTGMLGYLFLLCALPCLAVPAGNKPLVSQAW